MIIGVKPHWKPLIFLLKEVHSNWIIKQFIKVNGTGLPVIEKEEVLCYGKMAVNILVIGNKIWHMEKEDFCMLMEMSMKEIGIKIKLRA